MQRKALPRLLQHHLQGRVKGTLSCCNPRLLLGDGELQLAAQVGDTSDFQLVDIIGKCRVKAKVGLCDPGKAGQVSSALLTALWSKHTLNYPEALSHDSFSFFFWQKKS